MGLFAHGVFSVKRKTKFIAAVLAFGAVVLAVFLIMSKPPAGVESERQSSGAEQQQEDRDQKLKILAEADKDSDGDGLKDWEEALYNTDPKNPDTDGDGTNDGGEAIQSRDPLKKGPNDKLVQPLVESRSPQDDKKNLTRNLTKNILESGVLEAIDQNGNLTSDNFLKKLRLPDNLNPDTLLEPERPITVKDLKIVSAADPEAVKKYFNSLYTIYAKYSALQQKSDLDILAGALRSGEYSRLAELDPIIRALGNMIGGVKNIPVPAAYQDIAVKELNYLLKTKRAIEIFRNTENDALAAALIVKPRIELLQELARLHEQTKSNLGTKGIVFNPKGDGVTFFQ